MDASRFEVQTGILRDSPIQDHTLQFRMPHSIDLALVWFRRDLRDHDHAALYHALQAAHRVYAVFVFDAEILDRLEDRHDRRVAFIHASVAELKTALARAGGDLIVLHGKGRNSRAGATPAGTGRIRQPGLRTFRNRPGCRGIPPPAGNRSRIPLVQGSGDF